MIFVYLSAIEYLLYWHGNIPKNKRPYMIVDLDDTHRIFLVDKDKIVSFSFVMNVKLCKSDMSDTNNYITGVFLRKHQITAREISEAKQILNSCNDLESLYCVSYLENNESLADNSLYLFEHLLFNEWGYLRFDHDPSHSREDIHPAEHFDVNFSPICTYKLGVNKQLEINEIINLINKKTACAKLMI